MSATPARLRRPAAPADHFLGVTKMVTPHPSRLTLRLC